MSIQKQILSDIKDAMRAKEEPKLTVLRGIKSAFINELVASDRTPQDTLSEDEALVVVAREAKRRKDSIRQFVDGGREDLAQEESIELKIIEKYLPTLMNLEEIEKIAIVKKDEMGIIDKAKMGILMREIMVDLKGKADGGDVKKVVEGLFNNL